MWMRTTTGLALAVGLLSLALYALPAAADVPPGGGGTSGGLNLNLDEMAAALALPVLTGAQGPNTIKDTPGDVIIRTPSAINLLTITNGKSHPVLLRVDVISGDPTGPGGGDTWQSDSFDCFLTGRETTTALVVRSGAGSNIFMECSTPLGLVNDNKFVAAKAANGIFWAAAADPVTGKTISEDVLFGDAVVVDVQRGMALSFGAIPFQAGHGFNNGNKVYSFDGEEYAKWPGAVVTNFIAPNGTASTPRAELILFTLDGTTGNPTAPRVSVAGLAYNDDEVAFDFQHEFDCFDVVGLANLSLNFTQPFLGSLSGHLQLVPQQVGTPGHDVHDATYGDGNNSRRRPVHGWLVQSVDPGAPIVMPGQPTALPAPPGQPNTINHAQGVFSAWGRPLSQGRAALVPFLQDLDPRLDAGPF